MTKRSTEADFVQEPAAMEQVRELLFGAQLKDMDNRFKRQEERFQREITDSRDSLKTRMDSLENFMKSEIASLLHRIKEEQGERENSLKDEQRDRSHSFEQLAKDIATLTEVLERKIAKMSDTLDATERELRALLLTETNSLSTKIDEKYEDALRVLSSTAAQIRDDMVHRSALSAMFTDVVMKLSAPSEYNYSGNNEQTHANKAANTESTGE